MMAFGCRMWDHLLSLWNTKNRPLKEGVLIALTMLRPYVSHKDAQFDKVDGIGRLLRLLIAEFDSRWAFDHLSLESLRLEVKSEDDHQPFVANTFRYGLNFTPSQAVAWAVLELQADCALEVNRLDLLSRSAR